MSQYKYKFTKGKEVIESIGYNLFNGAENAGIAITRADPLGTHYLQSTKFEDRVRYVWGAKLGEFGTNCYKVNQSYNKT